MRRSTRRKKPLAIVNDEDEDIAEEISAVEQNKKMGDAQDSSSDSDIENYLQPVDKLDLDSSFFQIQKSPEIQSFESIEKDIFAGTNRLSDMDSDESDPEQEPTPTTSKLNFDQLHSYTNKLDQMKQAIQNYKTKQKVADAKAKPHSDNISDLLALGEMQVDNPTDNHSLHSSDFHSCSEVEDNDWEEVEDKLTKPSTSLVKDGIQITVSLPDTMKKKKGVDLLASLKRRLNRIKKEHQVLIHKVHLLCWIAHGNYINKNLNSETILGLALSLIPSQHCYPPDRTDLTYLEQILNWYNKVMDLSEKLVSKQWSLEKVLTLQLTRRQAYNKKMFTYIFICILRALGIQCRLVLSFQVLPLRPLSNELHSLSTKANNKNEVKTDHKTTSKISEKNEPKQDTTRKKNSKEQIEKKTTENKKAKSDKVEKVGRGNSTKQSTEKESTSKLPSSTTQKGKTNPKQTKRQLAQLDGANDSSEPEKSTKPNLKNLSKESKRQCPKNHPKRLKKTPNYTETHSSSSEEEREEKTQRLINVQNLKDKLKPRSKASKSSDVKNEIVSIVKTRIKKEKEASRSKLAKSRQSKAKSEEDSDYAPDPIHKKYDSDDDFQQDKVKVKKRIEVKRNQPESENATKGMDVWVEVYLEAEEKWISVDVGKNQVHCVNQLYSRASHPVSYVIAWNNNNSIKDITQRYCTNWNTTTRLLRVDAKWWSATLKPYTGVKTARDKEEDEELAQLQLDKPLPSTISEYKNHPLYVLKRHLLKFEALYPPDLPPVGFIRNEPVYPRECVHVLHSREIWMKEAKQVKPAQQPYKIVKARPKYDKLSGKVITDLPLEVFGIWQVEDYIPPTAENGVVPRNAYGNVELFKPCMLPKGTVHLQLAGLNKVARKMGIDCVPAVVGFDFHSGWNHPTYDGFVVCEEQSEALVAAWFQDQEEQEKKELEKIEKRVYGNWRKLIKGLLIRERLKKRYDYGEPSSQGDSKGKKRKQKAAKFVTKKRRICSNSESD
uniref:Rad4 beta-hairpin domain-containing protein n=2 Tax=Photinus pyralis TaxID=7054 RepID=A0A1Y1MPJ7_PHOPY